MWLITTTGFFSVVEKRWDREGGTLTVRARARGDLDGLRASVLPELGTTAEDPAADYRFRAQAPREAVARAVHRLVQAIDYDNFKSAVHHVQGAGRARIYASVWNVLHRIQSEGQA